MNRLELSPHIALLGVPLGHGGVVAPRIANLAGKGMFPDHRALPGMDRRRTTGHLGQSGLVGQARRATRQAVYVERIGECVEAAPALFQPRISLGLAVNLALIFTLASFIPAGAFGIFTLVF